MRSQQCVFNSASALRRVFVANALERVGTRSQLSSLLLPLSRSGTQTRTFRGYGGGGGSQNKSQAAKGLPRDDEITHRFVQIRQENGRLSDPTPTNQVLYRLDTRTQSLVVLALPSASKSNGPQYPVCKIVDRKVEQRAQVEKQKVLRKKNVQTKEMEVNWGIDSHDLGHRLKQLRTFLEKGLKVEIVLLNKRGKKRKASKDEANEVLEKVKETMLEVPGAKESKAMDGQVQATLRMFLEGPVGGVSQPAEAEEESG